MPALFSALSGETTSSGLSVLMILAKATVVLLAALGIRWLHAAHTGRFGQGLVDALEKDDQTMGST